MKLKAEYAVRRNGKIQFNCANPLEAVKLATYYNGKRDPDSPEYVPSARRVSEWRAIS